MVSETCQQYMHHIDAAAVHSGPVQGVLGILDSAQRTAEACSSNSHGQLESFLMDATQRLHAALTDLAQNLAEEPNSTMAAAVAGVTSCPQSSATQVAAFQQLLAQEQALGMLCSAVDKAREGKHQYLSGTLHNVAKALANAQPQPDMQEALLAAGYGSRLGLEGSLQQQDSAPTSDEQEEQPQRLLQRPLNYLSTMLTYMAQVGDAVAEADPAPSEAQNYFAMLQETPRMLLPRLVAQWGCSDSTAERVAALLGLDLVHEVIKAVIDPVHLGLGASALSHEMPASGRPKKAGCNCQTCASAAAFGEALSGVTCRVPLPKQAASPAGSSECESLPEDLQSQEHTQEPPEDVNLAAESSILPILGSVGSSTGGRASIRSLRYPVLKELHAIAPLRASFAAIVALIEDSAAHAEGSAPLAPAAPASAAGGKKADLTLRLAGHDEYDSSDSELAEAEGKNGRSANGICSRFNKGAETEKLLFLALQGNDAMEPLRQWLKLLLQSSPKLASLHAIAADHGEMPAIPACDHRRTAKKLAEAGRWPEAVQLAQEKGTLDDALLLRAIDGLADQDRRDDTHGDAQDMLWEWCHCLDNKEAAAKAILHCLDCWDLDRAQELLEWAQGHLPADHPLQKDLQEALTDLSFCQHVLSNPGASSEFKSWQSIRRLLDDDAVLLGRRLITCGAHAAAKDLCLIRPLPASYKIEAQVVHLSTVMSGGDAGGNLLDVIRCLKALPEDHAIAVALKLAGAPDLASGSAHSLLLSFLKERAASLSNEQKQALDAICLSLHVPQPWRDRLNHLLGRPELMLESLVMAQQFEAARQFLRQAPRLHSNDLLRQYARKAVDCHSGASTQLASSTARSGMDLAPQVLSGDVERDVSIRRNFRYLTAPNARLVASILSLSTSELAAAESALRVASDLAQQQLTAKSETRAEDETLVEPALEAASAAVALLEYAGEHLDSIAKAGHKSVKASAAAATLRAEVAELAKKADLIQVLLGNSIPVSMQSLDTEEQVKRLMGQLLQQEHYGLAAYVGKRWGLPVQLVWEQWARSLILLGRYEDAETRLKQAIKLADDSHGSSTPEEITLSFVKALEETAPLNLDGLQSLCSALTTAALQEADDPLSVNEYLKVLTGSQSLPTPQAAAYKSIPEAQMVGQRIALAERLLGEHAPGSLLPFMFQHGRAAAACQLAFPPEGEADGSKRARYSADDVLELACEHGELRTLQRTLAAGGARGRKALTDICEKLSQLPGHRNGDEPAGAADMLPVLDRLQFVQRCHLAMHRPDLAGQACVQLSCLAPDFESAIRQLANAVLHFESASRGGGTAALNKAEATECVMLAQMQSAVYKEIAASAASEGRSVFGMRLPSLGQTAQSGLSPGNFCLFEDVPGSGLPSAQERRLAVALRLLPQRFDLGFCALHAFCPAQTARIFAAVVSKLAGQGRTAELRSLLQNIQGTVTSDEWDQVLAAAVNALATAHEGVGRWSAAWSGNEGFSSPTEELVLSMHSPHAQVEAFLRLLRCEEAFKIARKAGNIADVRRVMAEAHLRADANVVALCTQYLQG